MKARWTSAQHRQFTGTQTEHELQCDCVAWFRRAYPHKKRLLFAIPNGAKLAPATGKKIEHLDEKTRRGIAWKRLEKEGAVKGAADLLLSIPSGDFCGLYIETKTPRGRQRPDQELFEADVLREGYGYAMPRSLAEFQQLIIVYLEKGEY